MYRWRCRWPYATVATNRTDQLGHVRRCQSARSLLYLLHWSLWARTAHYRLPPFVHIITIVICMCLATNTTVDSGAAARAADYIWWYVVIGVCEGDCLVLSARDSQSGGPGSSLFSGITDCLVTSVGQVLTRMHSSWQTIQAFRPSGVGRIVPALVGS